MDNSKSRQKRLLERRQALGYVRFHLWASEADYAQIKDLLSQRTLGQNVTERSAQLVRQIVKNLVNVNADVNTDDPLVSVDESSNILTDVIIEVDVNIEDSACETRRAEGQTESFNFTKRSDILLHEFKQVNHETIAMDEFFAPPPPLSNNSISTRRPGRPRVEEQIQKDPDTHDLEFVRRIKIAHRESPHRDLNYTEIANRLDVAKATVSAWFNGTRKPQNNMNEVARFFGVSPNWLRYGQEPMRPQPPTALMLLAQELSVLPPYKAEFVGYVLRLLGRETVDVQKVKQLEALVGRVLLS